MNKYERLRILTWLARKRYDDQLLMTFLKFHGYTKSNPIVNDDDIAMWNALIDHFEKLEETDE